MVDAGQEATAQSCAHRQCQRRRHPRLRTEFCWEVAQIHSCGQAPACLRTNRSLAISRFGIRKRLIGSVAIDGYDSSIPTKTLAQSWSNHSGLKIMFSFWLSKMTRHISEAEASLKIITGAQTLEIITERAIESSVVEEKQRDFLLASSRSTSNQYPAGPSAITVIFVLEQRFFVLSSHLQPVVKSCRNVIGSHAPIFGWAETAQLEEHQIMFTSDIEALYPGIQVWPGVGCLCLFDVVERAIRCFSTHLNQTWSSFW